MVEIDFITALQSYLSRPGLLQPPPALIGIVDPIQNTELPAVVLSLENLVRRGSGLGDRSVVITDSALPLQASIDLANPVLPEDPSVVLLSPNRLELTLPHGGLVRADATTGPLGPSDLTVTVAGVNRPVVTGVPAGNEVQADPAIGRLLFATPLPASGIVVAIYFLGVWEQRVLRMSGKLKVAIWTAAAATTAELSASLITALGATGPIGLKGLEELSLEELGTIAAAPPSFPGARSRVIRFGFLFESEINVPESSGGIIRRIPIDAFVS
jgi:hypothetical protein